MGAASSACALATQMFPTGIGQITFRVESGCGFRHASKVTPEDPPQLQPEEHQWIESAREWVRGHFTGNAKVKYQTIEGKLRVIAAILENGWVQPSETWKLQSLGIAFGDAIAQKLMLEWVTVDDAEGRCPALHWPGTSIITYPMTMISKRMEDGEQVDVYELFDRMSEGTAEIAFSQRYL